MTSLSSVFLPLKSNIGWFQSSNLQKDMTNKVKLALLLYDKLLIEDGTFEGQVLERGSSNFYHPPGSLPSEYRNIEYERDIKPTKYALSMSEEGSSTYHTFLHGNTIERFKIDMLYKIFYSQFYKRQQHQLSGLPPALKGARKSECAPTRRNSPSGWVT